MSMLTQGTTASPIGNSSVVRGKNPYPARTAEWYEKWYYARGAVPNYADYFARGQESSARVRASLPCHLDIRYAKEHSLQSLDWFITESSSPAPLLIFIHGGYWRSLDKSDFSFIVPGFVEAGVQVAVINYRLLPGVDLYTLTRDVLRAVVWCYRHAVDYGADPDDIHLSGHSAGGHLVAMLLSAQWQRWEKDLPDDLIKSGVAISGLYDLAHLREAPFLQADLRLSESSAEHLSPLCLPPATKSPLLLAVGSAENPGFIWQAEQMQKVWRAVVSDYYLIPGANHFSICAEYADPNSRLFTAGLDLIKAK